MQPTWALVFTVSGSNAFENQGSVGPPEPKRIRQGGAQRHAPGRVGHIIEIASRVLVKQVRGRGRDLIANREHRENRLHSSGRTEQVPGHGFRRADCKLPCMIAEAAFDRYGLGEIAQRCRGSVGVDVVDVLAIESGVAQGVFHAAGGPFSVLLWRGHVVGVTAHPVTGKLGVDLRAAPPATIASQSPYSIRRPDSPMQCAEVVQAVTIARFGPFSPCMIDRFPEIMLMIVLGMKNGEILRGPPFSTSLCVSSIIGRPPMPEPILTPMRGAFASVTSRPESFSA